MVSSATASHYLGISVDNLTSENIQKFHLSSQDEGVVIVDVEPSSSSVKAGLTPGSLILAVNHQKVKNVKEFNDALKGVKAGDRVLILVKQGEAIRFFSIRANE